MCFIVIDASVYKPVSCVFVSDVCNRSVPIAELQMERRRRRGKVAPRHSVLAASAFPATIGLYLNDVADEMGPLAVVPVEPQWLSPLEYERQ